MKCIGAAARRSIEVRRHNAAFCEDCFVQSFRDQVKRAIRHHDMFADDDRILVAVSGGKDSLALWDVLLDLGLRRLPASTWGWASAGTQIAVRRRDASVRAGARRGARRRRPGAGLRLRHPDRGPQGLPLDLRRLRPVEAVRLQPRGARGRVRRGRHRPQPGRRGRHAAREHAALADRVHRPAVAGPARQGRHGEEGEAALPAQRSSRPPATRSCAASTTWWRSARSWPATRSSATRRP